MSKQFPPDYFLNLFEPIPARKWKTKSRGFPGGPRCAMGHIWEAISSQRDDELLFRCILKIMQCTSALGVIISKTLDKTSESFTEDGYSAIVGINDTNDFVKGNGPRDRILKVLKQAKKKGII